MEKTVLRAKEIQDTLATLALRIQDRFPGSGLLKACESLHEISKETTDIVAWIRRPQYFLRFLILALVVSVGALVAYSIKNARFNLGEMTLANFIQISEAAMSELIFIVAGLASLVALETRRKRARVIGAVNRLRCIAHVIDMHQLTKDPDSTARFRQPTPHSPKREMNEYELGRYLDYCSEMLALASKLGFIYIQDFEDAVANGAVNELEALTGGLSAKIWQKIIILRSNAPLQSASAAPSAALLAAPPRPAAAQPSSASTQSPAPAQAAASSPVTAAAAK